MIKVRPARPADYPVVAGLTVRAYRDAGQVTAGHPYEQVLREVPQRAAAGELLVAEADGEVLGSVLFVLPGSDYAELSAAGEAEFRTLAVDPRAQGSGVGQALVRACLARAAARGCEAMVLYTRDIATAAQRLYARLGFVRAPARDWAPRPDVRLWAMRRPVTAADADPDGVPATHDDVGEAVDARADVGGAADKGGRP